MLARSPNRSVFRPSNRSVSGPRESSPILPVSVRKLAANSWTNGSFDSVNVIPAGSDAELRWTVESDSIFTYIIGFSATSDAADGTIASIDFGFYPTGDNVISYEDGVVANSVGVARADGDIFSVKKVGTTLTYRKNDLVIYASAKALDYDVIIDCTPNRYLTVIRDMRLFIDGIEVQIELQNLVGMEIL